MNIFGLIAYFEAFWSLKNDLKVFIKNAYDTIFMYENYKVVILSQKKQIFQKSPKKMSA